jgi:hypothetical protein
MQHHLDMCTVVETPILVASFTNERLSLCANVREVPGSEEHELVVVAALSGEVVITRVLPDRDQAVAAAKSITAIVP